MRIAKSDSGFTLVEVIVSLAIFSLIASVVLTLYLQGVISWRQQEQELDVQDNLRLAMDRIVREARQAQSIQIDKIGNPPYESPPVLVLDKKTLYYRSGTNLYRKWLSTSGNWATAPLASHIAGFSPSLNESVLSIILTGQTDGGRTINLSTMVQPRALTAK